MPKLKLSNEELKNIINDYNSGISLNKIVQKYHHDRNTLKRALQENNIKLRTRTEALQISQDKKEADKLKRKYFVNDKYFSIQNSKMAYLMGFLMADGNISKTDNRVQICLSEQDADFLELFYNEIGGAPITHYTQNNGKQKICRWQCLSGEIKRDLSTYDIIPNKTGFAKIPAKLNKEFYPDFIRGYFDGDGCIWIEKNSGAVGFSLTSHNKEILEQVIDFFEENEIPRVTIKEDNRYNINYSFKYRKKASEKIYKLLYYSDDCFRMKRKFDKFTEIILKK